MTPADHALDASARTTARYVIGLFLLLVLLQRFAVPATDAALLIPAVLAWCALALRRGVAVIDRTRAALWAAAFGTTALVIPVQAAFVDSASASLPSWGLFMVVWAPFVLRLVDNRTATYLAVLRGTSVVGTWLAVVSVVMVLSQVAGFAYRDWFALVVPESLQLSGFVITYPVTYDSDLYRANAWIGLEPSMVSAQIGLAVLASVYVRASALRLCVLMAGLVATVSGSGLALLGVGVLVMAVHPVRRALYRYFPVMGVVAFAATSTPFGVILLERVTEFQRDGSSTSLRATEPYRYLWPSWVEERASVLLGLGPGSAQDVVERTRVLGLLVPSPAKVFFEYGLLAGGVLAVFLLVCYVGGPARGFSVSLLLSLWLIQPGTTTLLITAPLLIFVTLWSPRRGPVLEVQPTVLWARPGGRATRSDVVAPVPQAVL